MPGLPFGAAQSHAVPQELRSYDHIDGFKFIEIDPDLPYPRSAAYRKTPEGAQMLIRRADPDLFETTLSADEARALIDNLRDAGVFDWQRVYKPVQGNFVNVVTQWRIELEFDQPIARRTTVFKSEGADEYPDSYRQALELLLNQGVEPADA